MLQTGKQKIQGFSLVEILVSMGIFSVIITSVVFITLSMINAQKKIQARIFLTQTVQTTLDSMSRQLRYGYSYSGAANSDQYITSGGEIILKTIDTSETANSSASTTAQLSDSVGSAYIIFESQDGNPDSFQDQNAFCVFNSKLYKVSDFSIDTANAGVYSKKCGDGSEMLPDDVYIDSLTFDIFSDNVDNPKSPRVRIMMKLRHEDGGTIEVQTTVTQRLVTYF